MLAFALLCVLCLAMYSCNDAAEPVKSETLSQTEIMDGFIGDRLAFGKQADGYYEVHICEFKNEKVSEHTLLYNYTSETEATEAYGHFKETDPDGTYTLNGTIVTYVVPKDSEWNGITYGRSKAEITEYYTSKGYTQQILSVTVEQS